MRLLRAPLPTSILLALALAAPAFGAEATNSSEDLRTGWYPEASSITPELVSGGTFGQLWSTPVEGQVYAQPLLGDGTLLVATEDDDVYGMDPATGAVKWSTSLGSPWKASEIDCGDLAPTIGATATPVIDEETGIAYLTHKAYVSGDSGPVRWYMDALDMASGAEEPGFPVELSGSAQNAPGQTFEPETELQRPGLLLMEGVVYAAFGSECDTAPWQGWVFGVSTAGAVRARWSSEVEGSGAGIWQSGAGLTSDAPGSILLATGNGAVPKSPTLGSEPPGSLGEAIVRLRVQPDGSLKATDFFAPYNASELDSWDADFASGGVTGLPDAYFGTPSIPHLAVAVGKDGYVYLLNRDNLGGIGEGPDGSDDVVQRIGPYGGVWSRPGVWPGEGGWVYIPTASSGDSAEGSSGNLRVYSYGLSGSGTPSLSLQGTSSDAFGFSSGAPIITSEGTTPGSALVWVIWAPNGTGEGAQLRAYDPIPVDGQPVLRWSAPIGTSAKFATPGVGAGRLYVGTRDGHVLAFGSPVTPVLSAPPTAFEATTDGDSSQQTVTITANETLTVTSLSSSSSEFVPGKPSPALPATLASGETLELPVTFSPTGTGPLGATLTASTSSGKTATFSLSGTGRAAGPRLEASPPLVTFGATSVGESVSAGATFRNVGGAPLTIEGVRLPSAPFSATGPPAVGETIEPGASVTVTVTFDPTSVGEFNDQIDLDTSGGDEAVGLSGSAGLPGALRIEGEANEFGEVALGTTAKRTFTVTNTGGTAVTIEKSKPPSGGEFAATTTLAEGTTIAPGESLTEQVVFAPTALGPASAVWPINGNDPTGLREVRFSGVGVEASSEAPLSSPETPPVTPPETPHLVAGLGGTGMPGEVGLLAAHETKAPAGIPDVRLLASKLRASASGVVAVALSCPASVSGCTGTIALRLVELVRGRSGTDRTVLLTLASGRFSVAGGTSKTVRLRLSPGARPQPHAARARDLERPRSRRRRAHGVRDGGDQRGSVEVGDRVDLGPLQHGRRGRLPGLARQVVHGVGVATQLEDGGDRPAVGGVGLADPQQAVMPLAPALDLLYSSVVRDGSRALFGLFAEHQVVALGGGVVGL